MRRAAKVDGNQAAIVEALRKAGYSVAVTSTVGKGFVDLVVGGFGCNVLMEIKVAGEKLNAEQSLFHSFWRGPIVIAHSPSEALGLMQARSWQ